MKLEYKHLEEEALKESKSDFRTLPLIDHAIPDFRGKLNAKGDRIYAINAAIIFENEIDLILKILLPKYLILEKNRELTFSVKTKLLKSFNLLENDIFIQINMVRDIRNYFAHNLDKSSIKDLPEKYKSKFKTAQTLRKHKNSTEKSLLEEFSEIVIAIWLELMEYRISIYSYRKTIDSNEFRKAFNDTRKKDSFEFYTENKDLIDQRIKKIRNAI